MTITYVDAEETRIDYLSHKQLQSHVQALF